MRRPLEIPVRLSRWPLSGRQFGAQRLCVVGSWKGKNGPAWRPFFGLELWSQALIARLWLANFALLGG